MRKKRSQNSRSQNGFTLLEMLIVVVIIGLLSAVAAPGWLGFLERNRLTTASDKLHTGLRDAQSQAQYKGLAWQFSLRELDGKIEWASHPKSVLPDEATWESVGVESIKIDEETTFATEGDVYYVRFNEDGNVQYRLGRVTLSGASGSKTKRCVMVSTIIGAMRKSKEQATPRDGKLCY